LQPYHRGDKARGHPLWVLHELSNLDKHRLPYYSLPVLKEIEVRGETRGIRVSSMRFFPGPFVDGAIVARLFVIPTAAESVMHVDFNITVGITLMRASCWARKSFPLFKRSGML
jgi:hypothetical protein